MDKRTRRAQLEDKSYELSGSADSSEASDESASSEGKRFDLGAMLKQNPQAARIGAAVAVLLILVLVWFFAFSGTDKKKSRRAGPPSTPPSQGVTQQPDVGDDAMDEADSPPDADVPDEAEDATAPPDAPADEPEPEIPPLPEDVSQWDSSHFERARRENDPKLLDAVGHLGRTSTDREAAAETLATLLLPLEEPADAAGDAASGGSAGVVHHGRTTDAGRLAEAVVEALAMNDTAPARRTLERVISGDIVAGGAETKVVEAALTALAAQPTPGNEELLLRLLTSAEQYREPSGNGLGVSPTQRGSGAAGQPVSAEWLRGRVLSLVEPSASMGFRSKLATFLMQPTTPLAWRAAMSKFLLEPTADNLGAQFIMYQSERIEAQVRTQIEEHFASRSARAMQAVLGVSQPTAGTGRGIVAPRAGSGRPDAAEDPHLPFRLARQLWGERSTEAFAQRLAELDRRDDRGRLLALCATMPVETVRSALLKTLRARHAHGPDDLEKAGVPSVLVSDPGLVLVVKSLDRLEPTTGPTVRPGTRGQPQPGAGRTAEDPGRKWMEYSETLVRSWCDQFDAAAHIQAEQARLAGKNPEELRRLDDLPLELHEGAAVRATYHLVLPAASAEKLSGALVGPMRIQYVRIEERTSIKRMVGYYRRATRVRDGRPTDDGVWFDTYRSAGAPGVRCSLDVLVRLADKKGTRDIDPEVDENLTIEVLSIEAREP